MADTSASGNGFGSRPGAINRSGRPSPLAEFRVMLADTLGREQDGQANLQAIVDKLVADARAGDSDARKLVLLYHVGRPAYQITTEPEGKPRSLVLVVQNPDGTERREILTGADASEDSSDRLGDTLS